MRASPVERRRRARIALTAALSAASITAVASAAFTSKSSSSETIATANLSAPTGLAAACVTLSSNVTLTWTATVSTVASGYKILRATTTGGPYVPIATVSGRTTTTYTDTIGLLQTQYYVVEATRNNWTSANSNQAGVHNVGLGVCTQA